MSTKSDPTFSQIITLLIGLLIVGGLFKMCNWMFKEDTPEEIEQEFVESMPKSTVDFFKNFECGLLDYAPKNVILKKAFVVETNNTTICKLFDCGNYYFSDNKTVSQYVTDDINEANVIIWINNFGKKEGEYSNKSPAIRKWAEINFIEIDNKIIYKKVEIPFNGQAPQYIERKAGLSNNEEFFGDRPDKEILLCFMKEILESRKKQ